MTRCSPSLMSRNSPSARNNPTTPPMPISSTNISTQWRPEHFDTAFCFLRNKQEFTIFTEREKSRFYSSAASGNQPAEEHDFLGVGDEVDDDCAVMTNSPFKTNSNNSTLVNNGSSAPQFLAEWSYDSSVSYFLLSSPQQGSNSTTRSHSSNASSPKNQPSRRRRHHRHHHGKINNISKTRQRKSQKRNLLGYTKIGTNANVTLFFDASHKCVARVLNNVSQNPTMAHYYDANDSLFMIRRQVSDTKWIYLHSNGRSEIGVLEMVRSEGGGRGANYIHSSSVATKRILRCHFLQSTKSSSSESSQSALSRRANNVISHKTPTKQHLIASSPSSLRNKLSPSSPSVWSVDDFAEKRQASSPSPLTPTPNNTSGAMSDMEFSSNSLQSTLRRALEKTSEYANSPTAYSPSSGSSINNKTMELFTSLVLDDDEDDESFARSKPSPHFKKFTPPPLDSSLIGNNKRLGRNSAISSSSVSSEYYAIDSHLVSPQCSAKSDTMDQYSFDNLLKNTSKHGLSVLRTRQLACNLRYCVLSSRQLLTLLQELDSHMEDHERARLISSARLSDSTYWKDILYLVRDLRLRSRASAKTEFVKDA